jgi:hypothetical protein
MFAPVLLATALSVLDVPWMTTKPVPVLQCSVLVGCHVVLPNGVQLRKVTVTDPRFTANILSTGGAVPAEIEILPVAGLIPMPDGGSAILTGSMDATTGDLIHPDYQVLLQADEDQVSRRLVFLKPPQRVIPPPSPNDALVDANETVMLDPGEMDFGYRAPGCVTVFSYRSQVWCKLPSEIVQAPVVTLLGPTIAMAPSVRVVARRYVVVDSLQVPMRLQFTGNVYATIQVVRAHE